METLIVWIVAIIAQIGSGYLLTRFLRHAQRKGVWYGLLGFPLLLVVWFGYELLQRNGQLSLSAFLATGASLLEFALLWVLLPPTREALTQYDQIREEKEESQQILDHLPIWVVLKDLGSNYRKVNSYFAQTLGKAVDLLIGRSDADFFPPKIVQGLQEDEKRAIAAKQAVTRNLELITVKGNRWFELTFIPLIDKLGVTQGVLVNGYDVTEHVEKIQSLEDQLRLKEIFSLAVRKFFACEEESELENVLLETMEELSGTVNIVLASVLEGGESVLLSKARREDLFQIGSSFPIGGGLLGKVIRSGQLQTSEDVSSWKNLLCEENREEKATQFRWAIGLPLFLESRVWGVVLFLFERPNHPIGARLSEFLSDVAQVASLVLNDLQRRKEMEKRIVQSQRDIEKLTLRQRIDHFLTALAIRLMNAQPNQIDNLLEKALATFAEYVGAEKGYVYLFTRDGGGLQARFRWASAGRLYPPIDISEPFDATVSWLLEKINRQEIVVLSRSDELNEAFRIYFDAQAIDCLIAVPIVLRRTVMGYLGFEGLQEGATTMMAQVETMKSLADLLISALDRKWNAEELEERLRVVGEKIASLELKTQRSKVLTEMADLLQSCRTADEAFPIIAHYVQTLLPPSNGALYLLRSLQGVAEKVAHWGDDSSGENELALNECWGIRRGKIHVSLNAEGPICEHLGTPIPKVYVCAPLIAQGETIGLLHIRDLEGEYQQRMDEVRGLALSIAEHIAPALSNLNLRDKLRSQAIRDPLTGLFNRRYMEETLDREIRRAERHKYSVGLIMCDIDQMKPINDRFGHDAGDVVLRQIGGLMKKIFRGEDVACRYGGDEFMIILPEAALSDVWQRAEHLRELVKKTRYEYEGKPIGPVTLSIGVAAFPDFGSTVERLIQVSDAAVYLAKHEGGDRVMIAHRNEENNK